MAEIYQIFQEDKLKANEIEIIIEKSASMMQVFPSELLKEENTDIEMKPDSLYFDDSDWIDHAIH